jgi:hypothetical protein
LVRLISLKTKEEEEEKRVREIEGEEERGV